MARFSCEAQCSPRDVDRIPILPIDISAQGSDVWPWLCTRVISKSRGTSDRVAKAQRGDPCRGHPPNESHRAHLDSAHLAATACGAAPWRHKAAQPTAHGSRVRLEARTAHTTSAACRRFCHRIPSCAACPGRVLPRYVLLRAAPDSCRWALGPQPLLVPGVSEPAQGTDAGARSAR